MMHCLGASGQTMIFSFHIFYTSYFHLVCTSSFGFPSFILRMKGLKVIRTLNLYFSKRDLRIRMDYSVTYNSSTTSMMNFLLFLTSGLSKLADLIKPITLFLNSSSSILSWSTYFSGSIFFYYTISYVSYLWYPLSLILISQIYTLTPVSNRNDQANYTHKVQQFWFSSPFSAFFLQWL